MLFTGPNKLLDECMVRLASSSGFLQTQEQIVVHEFGIVSPNVERYQ